MSVVYIALPIALGLGALGLWACIVCIRSGQFDDLDTPPLRMLLDDKAQSRESASNHTPEPLERSDNSEA